MTEKAFHEKHPIISTVISTGIVAIVSIVGTWLFCQKDAREAAEKAIVKNTQIIVDKIADEFEEIDRGAEIDVVLGQLKKDYDEAIQYKVMYDGAKDEISKNEEKIKTLEDDVEELTNDNKQKDKAYADLNNRYVNLRNLLLNSKSEEELVNAEKNGSVRVKNWENMYEIQAFSSNNYYSEDTVIDNYGNVHGKTCYYHVLSVPAYSRFRLDDKYDIFTFKFAMTSRASENLKFLVEFFVDDYPVQSFENVNKQTPMEEHTIPVNGEVFEIRVSYLEGQGDLYFVDGQFKNLE